MLSNRVIKAISTAKKYPYIIRVGVFGSCARDEETPTSDIDILIDYDNSSDDFLDDIGGFMEDMERLLNDKIDYVTVPGLMKSHDESFRRNVLNDVKWIYRVND